VLLGLALLPVLRGGRHRQKHNAASNAKPASPPIIPPTIAPVWFLYFNGATAGDVVVDCDALVDDEELDDVVVGVADVEVEATVDEFEDVEVLDVEVVVFCSAAVKADENSDRARTSVAI
jgi:hypothetical protein